MSAVKEKVFRLGKKRAFSLAAVLIIAFVGLALVGAIMSNFESFGGSMRASGVSKLDYNLLHDGVEKGKAILKEFMANEDPPPQGMHVNDVDELDDLLLDIGDSGVVYKKDLSVGEMAGRAGATAGKIIVQIFDMQYNPVLNPSILPEERAKLPPSVMLTGNTWEEVDREETDATEPLRSGGSTNSGVYLIRATLEISDAHDNKKIKVLDTSIVQSNLISGDLVP
ncbi:MAG: hypothetical protein LBT31_01225 [Synergistaceae bacterium]|jgi:hypothetical protein|nr:hypothetical protein [Synergistaceae bacterium]